jgi:hypothetical protein
VDAFVACVGGQEMVPILKKNYSDRQPIKEHVPLEQCVSASVLFHMYMSCMLCLSLYPISD